MSENNSGDSLLGMFIFETRQLLEQLEECILNTEKTSIYTQDDINEIFRIMHTIKGSSAMMGHNSILKLSHSLEDMFDFLRDEEVEDVDYQALSDLVFANIDFISEEIESIESGDHEDGDASDLMKSNLDFLDSIKKGTSDESQEESDDTDKDISGQAHSSKEEDKSQCKYSYRATIYFSKESEMENMRAFSIVNNLEEIAEDIQHIPEDLMDPSSAGLIQEDGFRFRLNSNYSYVHIHQLLMQTIFLENLELEQLDNEIELMATDKAKDKLSLEEEKVIDKQELEDKEVSEKPKAKDDNKRQPASPAGHHQSIISVPVDKLDILMDLMGEFVIAEAMVTQNPDLEGMDLTNFERSARQLNKITNDLQDIVMSIRMVPLSSTFNRMRRLVRDMSRQLDKEVELTIIGEETEVDKNIIEHISDPIMHLVRNALDHGLESTDERIKAGKPAKGRITLEAKNVGSDVLVIVKDDGKGISKEGVLTKARNRGLLNRPEAIMTDKEIYNLVLLPGFSTNENVTEYSGRGVGMDVVTKSIESLGGSVSIESKENAGTAFIMKIPLTLAIVDGMNLSVGESTYTIPTMNISEFFKPVMSDVIIDPDGNEMVMIRGECYPILRLHKTFKTESEKTNFEDGIFIMVQQDNNAFCVFADELIGQQQIVVKALPNYISQGRKVKGLTGCTLLGDGSISLILDVSGLSDLL